MRKGFERLKHAIIVREWPNRRAHVTHSNGGGSVADRDLRLWRQRSRMLLTLCSYCGVTSFASERGCPAGLRSDFQVDDAVVGKRKACCL
jgi:hypothetical protein